MKSTTIFSPGVKRPLSPHHHSCPNKAIPNQNDIVIIDVIGF